MFKKCVLFIIIFVQILTLSGCPDEDKSSAEEETEQIPGTMEQAYDELDQIITLLNGPMFSSRDMVEQLKAQQIQMLSEIIANQAGQMDMETQTGNGESEKKGQEKEAGNEKKQQQNENGNGKSDNKNEKEGSSSSGEEKKNSEQDSGKDNEQENGQDKSDEEDSQKSDAKDTEKLSNMNKAFWHYAVEGRKLEDDKGTYRQPLLHLERSPAGIT